MALTSAAMRCLEKLIRRIINSTVPETTDPLRFAHCPNKSVDDAVALDLCSARKHLDNHRAYTHMLFLDYSSALNTIWPSKLELKLADLGITTPHLTEHDCTNTYSHGNFIFKFADVIIIFKSIKDGKELPYRQLE